MYAIIEACGRQYKVQEGDVVFFEKLDTEEGKKVLTFAKETLASYQALLHSIKPTEDSVSGDISIVASKFFCEIILEQFLPLLRNHVPGIRTRLLEQEYQSIPTNFSSISFLYPYTGSFTIGCPI